MVAAEVKALANQTSRATDDVGRQVTAIQEATKRSVEEIAAIARVIAALKNVSTSIASAVEEQSTTTRDIAQSIHNAASQTERASAEIGSVAQAVSSGAAAVDAITQWTAELSTGRATSKPRSPPSSPASARRKVSLAAAATAGRTSQYLPFSRRDYARAMSNSELTLLVTTGLDPVVHVEAVSPDEAERNPGPIDEPLCRSRISLRFIRATKKKKGSGTPADAVFHVPHASSVRVAPRRRRLAPPSPLSGALACRRSTAALTKGSIPSPRGNPGQASWIRRLKRGHRRQRRTQLQRSTSHAGHSAGRHDARAAREQD